MFNNVTSTIELLYTEMDATIFVVVFGPIILIAVWGVLLLIGFKTVQQGKKTLKLNPFVTALTIVILPLIAVWPADHSENTAPGDAVVDYLGLLVAIFCSAAVGGLSIVTLKRMFSPSIQVLRGGFFFTFLVVLYGTYFPLYVVRDKFVFRTSLDPITVANLGPSGQTTNYKIPRAFIKDRSYRAGRISSRPQIWISVAYPSLQPWAYVVEKLGNPDDELKVDVFLHFNNSANLRVSESPKNIFKIGTHSRHQFLSSRFSNSNDLQNKIENLIASFEHAPKTMNAIRGQPKRF